MKNFILLVFIILIFNVSTTKAQTDFPSSTWNNATNLSSLFASKTYELSGLYWNDVKKQLFIVCDDGRLLILGFNASQNTFTLLTDNNDVSSPEGIMQVDNSSNEFYIIDESGFKIRKYAISSDYKTVDQITTWNLLNSPSPMSDTGNSGPEGITFIPDWYLNKIGFISSETGTVYQSKKGMGGLIFIANQTGGYLWVYDVNPNTKNDFLFVGKYKSAEDESCDLSFDNSTGLMYVLHNTGSNYLEVTDLKTSILSGEYKLNTVAEYNISNPTSGDDNVEGFALTPKYSNNSEVSAWLCRDVSSSSESADCLRWFHPFNSVGENIIKATVNDVYKNVFTVTTKTTSILISSNSNDCDKFEVQLYNSSGQLITTKNHVKFPVSFNVNQRGIYIVSVKSNGKVIYTKKVIF